jgi:hypothetical protein
MAYSSAVATAVLIEVIVILIIARRSYAMTQGVAYSTLRIAVLPGLLLAIWVLYELESLLLIPWAFPYLNALDLAILVATAFAFAPVAERMTVVNRDASGHGTIRIGITLAALYLGAFVIRVAVAVVLFPNSLVFGSQPGGFPPLPQQVVLAVIDGLFSFSAGLAVARSVGMRRKWVEAGKASRPVAPA